MIYLQLAAACAAANLIFHLVSGKRTWGQTAAVIAQQCAVLLALWLVGFQIIPPQ